MKILMVDSLVGNDYSFILSNALKLNGVDVQIVIPEDRQIEKYSELSVIRIMPPKNIPGNRIKKSIKYLLYLINLYRIILVENIDIVHFQFFRRSRIEAIYLLFLKLLKCKIVHTVHDISPLNESKIDYLFKMIVYKVADLLLVHSQINRINLEMLRLSSAKIKVVPHGNFDAIIPKHNFNSDTARNKLGITKENKVLLFFGFIKEYKGLDFLLKAVRDASKRIDDLSLIIVGKVDNNYLEEKYKNEIKLLPACIKVITCFKFIPKEYLPIYFLASDIVVLPYKRISHSGVLHLAYSFGKPVMAFGVGDFPESIEDGKSGFVISNTDSSSLTEKIIEAFSYPNRLEEMGKYARYLSETKYSWNNISLILKNIYSDLIIH